MEPGNPIKFNKLPVFNKFGINFNLRAPRAINIFPDYISMEFSDREYIYHWPEIISSQILTRSIMSGHYRFPVYDIILITKDNKFKFSVGPSAKPQTFENETEIIPELKKHLTLTEVNKLKSDVFAGWLTALVIILLTLSLIYLGIIPLK